MDPESSRWRALLRRLPIAVILVVAVLGTILLRDQIAFETLRDNRATLLEFRDQNYVAAVFAFMAAYIAIVTFSLPGAALSTIAGGFLFGIFPGVLYTVAAATIGATLVFLAARMGFGERLGAQIEASRGRIRTIREAIRENEIPALLLVRLVPVIPFFLANLVISTFGVSLGRFFVTTFVGIIPGGLVYTSIGNGLGELIAAGEAPDMGVIFQPQILLPLLGLAALAALPMIIRILRKKDS